MSDEPNSFFDNGFCKSCGYPPESHLKVTRDGGCVLITSSLPPEPKLQLESIEKELEANAEQAIQSLCKLIRSLGFDPYQFMRRVIERPNRETSTETLSWDDELKRLRDNGYRFDTDPEGRESSSTPINSDDRFANAIGEIRRLNEDENASEGAKARKNQMRDI